MTIDELTNKLVALKDATVAIPGALMGIANDVTSRSVAPNVVTNVSNKINGVTVKVAGIEGVSVNPKDVVSYGRTISTQLAVEGSNFSKNFIKDNWS